MVSNHIPEILQLSFSLRQRKYLGVTTDAPATDNEEIDDSESSLV
jgi:hypothetical protein